jgi:hypothetical protein
MRAEQRGMNVIFPREGGVIVITQDTLPAMGAPHGVSQRP